MAEKLFVTIAASLFILLIVLTVAGVVFVFNEGLKTVFGINNVGIFIFWSVVVFVGVLGFAFRRYNELEDSE
jgi:hypothetical protein